MLFALGKAKTSLGGKLSLSFQNDACQQKQRKASLNKAWIYFLLLFLIGPKIFISAIAKP